MKRVPYSVLALCALSVGCSAEGAFDVAQSGEAIVRGTRDDARKYVVLLKAATSDGYQYYCSGTYIGPRVVLTSAHCIPDVPNLAESYVYYGNDFANDEATLGQPAQPRKTSQWARVASFRVHPQWNWDTLHPDLAVVYLDRKLPFDPLPVARFRVDDSFVGNQATIVGYGASKALNIDGSEVEGFGVRRSGLTTIAGSPTAADYSEADPHPGLLVPSVAADMLKTDDSGSNASTCSGDSGGALIVQRSGKEYLAGVNHWSGLWCENYTYYPRLDSQLAWLDAAMKQGN